MATLYETLGIRIRKYRKENGMNTVDLADKLGVSSGLVNNIENGKHDVFKLELLKKIIDVLGVKPYELIQLEEYPQYYGSLGDYSNIYDTELIKPQLNLIVSSFINTINEYGYTKENIEIISTHIHNELETLVKLHKRNSQTL